MPVEEDNAVHVIEAFVEALDLPAMGFAGAARRCPKEPSSDTRGLLALQGFEAVLETLERPSARWDKAL
jgi:hypothetical protein